MQQSGVGQADYDEGCCEDGLTNVEREELRRLRRENRQLREEREWRLSCLPEADRFQKRRGVALRMDHTDTGGYR